MKIIAIAGMPCSGKGEFVEYLKAKGIPAITMSEVVEKEMESKGIEINNKNLREYATGLRKEKGMDIVARMCLPLIAKASKNADLLIIDGVRGYDEVKLFKKELTKDFILVSIFAPPKVRYERAVNRGKRSDMKTLEEFEWRDEVELGWGLGNVIALSDHMIHNSGSLEEMHTKIDELLSKITG